MRNHRKSPLPLAVASQRSVQAQSKQWAEGGVECCKTLNLGAAWWCCLCVEAWVMIFPVKIQEYFYVIRVTKAM